MKWPDFYLLCFAVGTIWSLATLLLGGLHFGHGHGVSGHHGVGHGHGHGGAHLGSISHWVGAMANPNGVAVFFAWFGGIGFLLTRHAGLHRLADLAIAVAFGLLGAWLLAAFLQFLQAREKPLDPADYEMVGVLGRISSPVRPSGIGELIYVRDGARKLMGARSEDGIAIARGEEVVVTRVEKGVAFVRTWDAMLTRQEGVHAPGTLHKETENVE